MADPLSLVGAIFALIGSTTKVVQELRTLKQSYSGAPTVLQLLAIDCTTTGAVLQRLEHVLRNRPQLLSPAAQGIPDLRISFETLVEGIEDSIHKLGRDVQKIAKSARDGDYEMSSTSKAKFLWKEEEFKASLQEIRDQRASLSFLLDCLQMESLVNIQVQLEGGSTQSLPLPIQAPNPAPKIQDGSTQAVPLPNSVPKPTSEIAGGSTQSLLPSIQAQGPAPLNGISQNMDSLSINSTKQGRPHIRISLPRELDIPELQSRIASIRPRKGEGYRKYSVYAAQAIHSAIENNNAKKLMADLSDRRHPDMILPGSNLTPLNRALSYGKDRKTIIYLLILAGAHLEARSETNLTPLMQAIDQKLDYYTIKLMCELGANANAKSTAPNRKGNTALHCAARIGPPDKVIMALIAHGADVNLKSDTTGRSALFYAVEKGHVRIARKLLDYGCDVDSDLPEGDTPLLAALDRGASSLELVKLLCDRGADVSRIHRDITPLSYATGRSCPVEVLKTLILAGARLNVIPDGCYSPLYVAADRNNLEALEYFISLQADVNLKSNGHWPIHGCVFGGTTLMLELLLKAGSLVDPVSEPKGLTPLALAVKYNKIDFMKILIQHGAYVDCEIPKSNSIFGIATDKRHVEAAKLLIDSGLDINGTIYVGGLDALHQVAFEGLDELVPILLQKGAYIETTTKRAGLTPLMVAAYAGRMSTFRLLLDRGANLHAKDSFGKGVLFHAAKHPSMIRFILSLGVDINLRDKHGATVLHEPSVYQVDIIASARVLLQKGAKQFYTTLMYEDDILQSGPHSGTPAEIARQMGKVTLAELLENWNYDR
ncbi:Fc.00g008580.m01.CDS01 [Cosmosporella sp. VM-42]